MREVFGALVRRHMQSKGCTQVSIARALHISPAAFHHLLSGRSRIPPARIDALVNALGLHGDERVALVLSAHLTRTPRPVVERLDELEAEVERLRRRLEQGSPSAGRRKRTAKP